ncbi:MAG TPA: zinc-dependent metalloprotease [Burkholderiaceae bacterium]|nr:zinc-dependent metalloprotease [Burkholderiaceae bacterium]
MLPTRPFAPARSSARLLALLLGACASPPPQPDAAPPVPVLASTPGAPATSGANGAAAATPPASGATLPRAAETTPPRPFAEIVRDAKETKGFFGVWQKDEKIWLEIKPNQLDKPLFFGIAIASGLGDFTYLPGLMGREQVVELHKVGTTLQLVARNLSVRAPAGSPLETAVRESYSDSLLASAPIASAPHPERKSILVDATTLLGGDIPGAQTTLETAYHVAYTLDRPNTSIEHARTGETGTFVTVRAHYAVPKLPVPPAGPLPPGAVIPAPIQTVPDSRSLFLTFTYNLTPLPATPMHPRIADQRVGHFTTAFIDYMGPSVDDRRTHYIARWRLEKKDPHAEISEPKEPILVWMDKNIPEKYRPAVQAGILEWNKAFERAGFRNALVVRQQPAEADWSTLDGTRHISVRWFAMIGPGAVAVGPRQVDLRTGEILSGAAIIPENWVRLGRLALGEVFPAPPAPSLLWGAQSDLCTYAQDALEHAAFGYELLAERGAIDPNGPDGDRFIADDLKQVVMHEMGHALGLRHNFRASTGITFAQLRDPAFVRTHGISNSVMDYVAYNLPLENETPSIYTQVTLGAYDYWAIDYAYHEFAPDVEKAELARLAAQSERNPALAFATDEDVAPAMGGIDPLVNQFDLGDDPLAYYKRRFVLVRELWGRTEKRELKPDENLALYRRNLVRGFNQMAFVGPLIAKYIGGVYTSRDLAGAREPVLTPVPVAKQRDALEVVAREIFSSDSFRFDPDFMRRLGIDYLDRGRLNQPVTATTPDFSLPTAVLGLQRTMLDILMSDAVAIRLADAETKVKSPRDLLTFADLQTRLTGAIWSELKSGRNVDSLRRNLQREHVRRVASAIVRATSPVAADVRAVERQVAVNLTADLKRALANPRLNTITRAHLAESAALLDEALKAPMMKQGA